ncbi:MAG: Druantia anti-phage system protein DruA [Thermodesulfobacteriota bacterium]
MEEWVRHRGKNYTLREIDEIREVIAAHGDKSRWFISREIWRKWNWVQLNGVLKDMICRGLLLRLNTQGLIELPPPRKSSPYLLSENRKPARVEVDQVPIVSKLFDLEPIELLQIRRTHFEKLYRGLVEQYHYLGYRCPVGEHLEYIAFSQGRPLACLGWSSAPRHIGCRDRYLGWTKEQRLKNLSRIVINTRFLILPWVRVSHLASHLLGLSARRIFQDWEKRYHHEVVWLETFVDPERGFEGTCYKGANWIYLGQTTGRGKDDRTNKVNRSLKLVFGYPLKKEFRQVLCE